MQISAEPRPLAPSGILNEWSLPIDVDAVLRGQGADPAVVRQRRPALVTTAQRAIDEGLPLLRPAVAYRQLAVEALRHEQLRLAGGAVINSPLMAQHLAPAEHVVLMVCTIGPALEQRVSEIMRGNPSFGLALDGFGSMAVEALVAAACDRFETRAAAQGGYTSIPLSPGMIGWPVDVGQRQIFSQVPAAAIGVSLLESAQMSPRKSSSLVLGVGPRPFSEGRACDFCSLRETCRYQDQHAHYGGQRRHP
jgi:hypothetical protein